MMTSAQVVETSVTELWTVDSFSFKTSRISDHISVSDSDTVLMDDCLKENQSSREQLRQHDEENALIKVQRAFKQTGLFV